jgi:hypothetical protein
MFLAAKEVAVSFMFQSLYPQENCHLQGRLLEASLEIVQTAYAVTMK